ncbi:cytochrome c oxidase subunit II [Kiloniella laminariae]|uniref:Cytochrome c oxidase subunit 2 n=1 Tax=Kiloniella laminariae TaxID=454162 RepID=A0ABT4LL21_9PROT|nr:cytochrome c oxidase subunit II [Kiloniella laminariae]MCZ4281777.1 cytochrome c oxidase subunit II [Kiloniella laminariae]
MTFLKRIAHLLGAAALMGGMATVAHAAQPTEWSLGLQEAATPVMEQIAEFHTLLMYIITGVTLLVLFLLLYVMFRFSEKRNPNPSTTSHNTLIEIIWTAVPVIILVIIAIPSFKLLYAADRNPDTEMTIKAIGKQWYWSYEYQDHGDFTFDAYMKAEDELEPGEPRLLATDNAVVVPVDTKIRLLVAGEDVIHSFAMPAFGLKLDAVPGRINETWFEATKTGTFYGQCSEICGTGHSYMPIMIKVVSKEEFNVWVEAAKEEFAAIKSDHSIQLAQLD